MGLNIKQIILSAKTGIVDPTAVTPDFTGQLYLNLTTVQLFYAKSTSVGDYELLADFSDLIASNITTNTTGQTVQDLLDALELNKMDIDGNNSNIDKLLFKDNLTNPSYQEGRIFYDKDEHTFAIYNDSSQITHQLGQETLVRVFNDTGSLIGDGKPVYIIGAEGTEGRPCIAEAQADVLITSDVIGVTTQSIPDQTFGYVTLVGLVNGVDTSGFSLGDTVYLSDSVAGGLVNILPSGGSFIIQIGHVLVVDGTNGRVLIDVIHLGSVPVIATKTIFFRPERVNSVGDYKVKALGQGANDNFTFLVPSDFQNLDSLDLIFAPANTIAVGKTVDLNSDYASIGENILTHSEAVLGQSIIGNADEFTLLDISTVFSSLGAEDICGFNLNLNNIGTTMYVFGLRLRYT